MVRILLALLCCVLKFPQIGWAESSEAKPEKLQLFTVEESRILEDALQCEQDFDCIAVATQCDVGNEWVINRAHEGKARAMLGVACERWFSRGWQIGGGEYLSGNQRVAACVRGKCKSIPLVRDDGQPQTLP